MRKILTALGILLSVYLCGNTIYDEPVKLQIKSDLKDLKGINANVVTTASDKVIVFVDKSSSQGRTAEVFNFWGEKVAAAVVPGVVTWFQFPRPEIGHYRLYLYDDGKPVASTRFSVVPPVRPLPQKRSFYGMSTHFSHLTYPAGTAAVLRAAGVSEIRDSCHWSRVELQKGQLSLNDPAVKMFAFGAKNFRALPIFCYGNKNYDKFSSPHTPEGIAAWRKYVEYCVRTFPQCSDWEIWNEFNCAFLLRGVVDPTPENYLALVKNTSDVIRKTNPKARVVGCATSLLPWQWLEKFFQLGGLQYLDVVSVHPYRWGNWTLPPETLYPDMIRLRKLIDKYANGRKIAIYADEFGYQNSVPETGISPEMQAVYLPRAFANIRRAGVERGYWYTFMQNFRDRANWRLGHYTKKRNFIPEPAYSSYAALTAVLDDCDYVKQTELQKGHAWELLFRKGDMPIRQLWAAATPFPFEIQTDQPVEVIDLMGVSRTMTPVNGKIILLLNNTTVYVKGAVKNVMRSKEFDLSMRRPACVGTPLYINLKMPADTVLDIRGWQVFPGAVELPGADRTGGNAVKGTILRNGKAAGHLFFQYEVAPQLTVEGMRLDKDGKTLVMLNNRYPGKSLKITGISGTINKKPFTLAAGDLPVFSGKTARETLTFALPLADFKPYNLYKVQLRIDFDKHTPIEDTETIGYNPCYKVNHIVWDAKLDDWEKVPWIDLKQAGQLRDLVGIHMCGNYSENTGRLWCAWNDKFLYYAAEINDAKFHQVFPIWQGDSLQIGIAPLKVDAQTTIELQAGWRPKYNHSMIFPSMVPVGFDGSAITRYTHTRFTHKDGKTIYEMAIPWKVLPFVKGKIGDLFRSTIIVNDNNGGTHRYAVLCWGDGITHTKSSKFYPIWVFEGEVK
ncbi:MAG: hypothetical protein IJW17_02265 [Lentisphaeria bacterium]|nr:hypothetical protein [Lentisphaeria bacterium]